MQNIFSPFKSDKGSACSAGWRPGLHFFHLSVCVHTRILSNTQHIQVHVLSHTGCLCLHVLSTGKQSFHVGKQMPQHSMQISRQSEDSQQASIIPQSMSQGQLQSSPRSSAQQQQQQASDVQAPHDA